MLRTPSRRLFLGSLAAAGAGSALIGASARGQTRIPGIWSAEMPVAGAHDHPGANHMVGTVDHARNEFDPHAMLTDFDAGTVVIDPDGRPTREWDVTAVDKEVEIAPGIFFPAWTFNGRIPGPTLRCTEGERLRIRFTNGSIHAHSMHFHGIHSWRMDGVPGRRHGAERR